MARNLFSVPIFFIVFRETLEAAIIVSVLLGLVEQIVNEDPSRATTLITQDSSPANDEKPGQGLEGVEPQLMTVGEIDEADHRVHKRRLVRKLRLQIFLGAALGLFIATAVGAAFIAVWFTQASNLYAKTEQLWEGIFELIASLMIFVMGITMLKMDRAKAKWRIKLEKAFSGQRVDSQTRTGKYILFVLPMITVLREGIEAVIFVGGVALGQPAVSIPIAAIVGLICGIVCGFLIYQFASRTTLTIFLIVMTNFLLLIGAGLFTKSISAFQENAFNHLLGADVDDSGGTGPGSYLVQGNVWHLNFGAPDISSGSATSEQEGWTIFNAIFGWTNNATVGSILGYVAYWVAVIITLVYMKHAEGRSKFLGRESAAGVRRREYREKMVRDGRSSPHASSSDSEKKNAEALESPPDVQ